jgi:protein-L-isoaspartate(D-aspartate) O-methyltransferase
MASSTSDRLTIDDYRRFYAEEIRAVADLESAALTEAFARVPRERFLGAPPWLVHSGPYIQVPVYRSTEDVRDLYHNVFVALKADKLLNNGAPGLIARLIAPLNLSPGKRVLHIGCGSGYYSAVMAETVGVEGSVTAVEVEPDLAVHATANLVGYSNVAVVNRDASSFVPGPSDAILVNAGVTHPHPSWIACLEDGGVLVLPLCVGKSQATKDALVVKIARRGSFYAAELLLVMSIYSSPSQRDPAIHALLNESLESRTIVGLKSVRVTEHERVDSCLVHTAGFCLSAESA